MSSLQKQAPHSLAETPEAYVASFEAALEQMNKVREVQTLMKKLKYLGLNFDPFGPEVTVECQQVIDNLGLTLHFKNPYQTTNILLRLLDKTEERLNKLKQ